MGNHTVHRYHDICAGHRVVGHEGKCRHLHGHNYRIHFNCESDGLDSLGRVIDFGVVKEKLCMWIEDNWDHKFLHWEKDPLISMLKDLVTAQKEPYLVSEETMFRGSLVALPFNPTAENLAEYLVNVIGPQQLSGTGVRLVSVKIEETAKCHVTYEV